jgi:hypothetical protein
MNGDFKFLINGRLFSIRDFGKEMNAGFLKLHEAYFSGTSFDFSDFRESSFKLLDSCKGDYKSQDNFFYNFIHIWAHFLERQLFGSAEQLWHDVLDLADNWEKINPGQRIHKGFPYYYRGVTLILNNDLDKGFLLMHQALEEDKITIWFYDSSNSSLLLRYSKLYQNR